MKVKKTKVKNISFSGNDHVSDAQLRGIISTKESGVVNTLLEKDVYNLEKLEADRQTIITYYRDRGYEDAQVEPADVIFEPTSHSVNVVFNVSEGIRYEMGSVTVDPTVKGVDTAAADYHGGRYFSPKAVEKTREGLQKKVDSEINGSALVDARPSRQVNGKMDVRFTVDKAQPVYISRIEITGNTETKDYVIRRELDFAEGDMLRPSLIDAAKRRLEALGLFKSVNIVTKPANERDRVVMTVNVEESKTGSFNIGAGYSPADGPLISLGVAQKNFLGTGRGVDFQINRGVRNSDYSLSLSEPYLLGYRMTGFVDLTHQIIGDYTSAHPFNETKSGMKFGVKAPVSDDLTGSLYYGFYSRNISNVAPAYQGIGISSSPFLIASGKSLTSYLGYGLAYNTVDDLKTPTNGGLINFDQRFAGVGGNTRYLRTEANAQYFAPLDADETWIGSVKVQGGNIVGIGQQLAYLDQLRNDSQLVRGFEAGGIGPRDAATGYSLGGQLYLGASAEASRPLPFIPESAGLRGSVFADAGSVFYPDPATVSASGSDVWSRQFALRAAVGLGVSWDSPIGMIKANFAVPVLKRSEDKPQIFSLSAGSSF